MEKRIGVLYGVSVGPGDPELMTLKAVHCLEKCPVIAAPQTAGGRMLALDIARAGWQDHPAPALCHEPRPGDAARLP